MMRFFLITVLILFTLLATAQTKNPSTVKEAEDRAKQAQQQLDNLTPEQKMMMEQMGIKIPTSAGTLPVGTTDAQVAMAAGGDGVPKRNAALIAAIPQVTLTAASLPAYIRSMNSYIDKKIEGGYKQFSQEVYAQFKSGGITTLGNTAVGFWTMGSREIGVCLMGKACSDNLTDADNLNNFAAMMSMAGAPQQAIPLLEYLNRQYPGNTTILNNLGQAWFYLGVTDKADEYLEKTVKAFAYHPQANYTQCLIAESKGNKTKAVEKMKNSLAYSYSLDKVNKLRQLGYSVKGRDMRIPFRPDPDPLGLRKFIRPDFPKSYDDEVTLKFAWDDFQQQISNKMTEVMKQLQPHINRAAQQAQQTYNAIQKNKGVAGLSLANSKKTRLYEKVAQRNLDDMEKDGGIEFRLRKAKAQLDSVVKAFVDQKESMRKKFEKDNSIKAQTETELSKKGEDLGYDDCKVQRIYSEWVHSKFNRLLDDEYKNYLHLLNLKISEELYWKQFIQDEVQFEATRLTADKEWLNALFSSRYLASADVNPANICPGSADKGSRQKLADFDEMHCKYNSVMDFKVYRLASNCGKLTVSFDADVLKGKFEFKAKGHGVDEFQKCTVEAKAKVGKSIEKGPLQVGASVGAGMGVEISRNGIEDVYLTGEASISAGINIIKTMEDHIAATDKMIGAGENNPNLGDIGISDQSVGITAEGKISLISGNTSGSIKGF